MTPRPTRAEAMADAKHAAEALLEAIIVLDGLLLDADYEQRQICTEATVACLKVPSLD